MVTTDIPSSRPAGATIWPDRVDVAVIGGGPSGAMAAERLVERGYAVLLVEIGRASWRERV